MTTTHYIPTNDERFTKENVIIEGGSERWVFYVPATGSYQDRRFVARYKYRGSPAAFRTFLVKHFTPAEYFGRLDAGETPLAILRSKGFVEPRFRKELREKGYPVTPEGFSQMVQDEWKRHSEVVAAAARA